MGTEIITFLNEIKIKLTAKELSQQLLLCVIISNSVW